jgi:hypothetical protein
MVTLKPVDFFTSSPSNDVPASNQRFNQSNLYKSIPAGSHGQGSHEVEMKAKAKGLGESCCVKTEATV